MEISFEFLILLRDGMKELVVDFDEIKETIVTYQCLFRPADVVQQFRES